MKLHQRHSFFPLVLGLLTLGLIVLMFYAFTGRTSQELTTTRTEETSVSAQEYKTSLQNLMNTFIARYVESTDDLSRLLLTEQTLEQLLVLRVPAENKSTHLQLAVDLNQLQQAFRTKNGQETEWFERIKSSYVSH